MKAINLVVDIASKFTIIGQEEKGVVIKEPSLVLLQTEKKETKLLECGNAVLKYVGSLQPNQQILYPIKEGAIFHEKAAALMFRNLFQRLLPNFSLIKPNIKVLGCVACGLTNTEKNTIEKVLISAGATEVVIVESPIAINCAIEDGSSRLIVDIGASKTDVAVVSKKGIVVGCTLDVGGDSFNRAIIDYIAYTRNCRLSASKVEKVKKQIGSLYENDTACMIVDVTDITSNTGVECKIYARDIKNAVQPLVDKIVEVIYNLTFQIPESIAEEVYINGIAVCGGSSYFAGLIEYISVAIKMQAYQVDNSSIIIGIGGLKLLENPNRLAEMLNLKTF